MVTRAAPRSAARRGRTGPAGGDLAPTFTVDRNRLTPLPSGKARLAALIALIDGAKASLRLLYYIYSPDKAGRAVRAALERAIDRGVTVALIVDGFGSAASPEFFQPLTDKGAEICHFCRNMAGAICCATTRSWRWRTGGSR